MMDGWWLAAFFGLAAAQVALYRISSKQALHHFWFLGFFYFFLFAFAQGLVIFSRHFSIPFFYEFPLFLLIVLILFRKTEKPFPQFGKRVRSAPDFYLFSAVWMGIVWLFFLANSKAQSLDAAQILYVRGFLWSLFPASILPALTGIRDRLTLLDPPRVLEGLPIFLIASGIFLLAFIFFWSFIN